jgi:two-component system, chemotaxis family, protein-glutamate methylesterase/glutaminase
MPRPPTTAAPKIRVLIVDDSAVMRRLLTDGLSRDPGVEVVGAAADPYIARTKIQRLHPDVLTLDVEMPRMDGLTFLAKLMRTTPMPVVMVSSGSPDVRAVTLRALELGAVNFVLKPQADLFGRMVDTVPEIIEKVREAAQARLRVVRPSPPSPAPRPRPLVPAGPKALVAVGASTGGTEAIRTLLAELPGDSPGVVIVQHMPEHFTRAFAARCNELSAMRVKEAEDGDEVRPGHVFIAPGNHHMRVVRSAQSYRVRVDQGEPVNRHRPSVDVLFHSVAEAAGSNTVGVLLTGMGADGARGLAALRRAGARTIAEDESSCVVFGMPREAIALGAAEYVLPMRAIGEAVLALAVRPVAASRAMGARRTSNAVDT